MKKNSGFTLIELVVVMAILAILAAVAVPAYSGYIKKANETADTQTLEGYNTAIAAALSMEGKDLKDAGNYFVYTSTTKELTEKASNDNPKVWKNFVQFYGLADNATAATIDVEFETVTFTNGVLTGSN